MRIRLNLKAEQITLDDLVMFDDLMSGAMPGRQMRDFVARFIVGENGAAFTKEQALKEAGRLNLGELKEVFDQLGQEIRELQAAAVPPLPGGA